MADPKTTVTRRTLAALEKVFTAEIGDRLPFQSKAKIYRDLCADGLLMPMTRRFGNGALAVTCVGYELTHAGRMLYCASCDDAEEEPSGTPSPRP